MKICVLSLCGSMKICVDHSKYLAIYENLYGSMNENIFRSMKIKLKVRIN